MNLLEWLLLGVFFLLVAFAHLPLSAVSLAVLCFLFAAIRIARGERIP